MEYMKTLCQYNNMEDSIKHCILYFVFIWCGVQTIWYHLLFVIQLLIKIDLNI
jgi:hypothetical protein